MLYIVTSFCLHHMCIWVCVISLNNSKHTYHQHHTQIHRKYLKNRNFLKNGSLPWQPLQCSDIFFTFCIKIGYPTINDRIGKERPRPAANLHRGPSLTLKITILTKFENMYCFHSNHIVAIATRNYRLIFLWSRTLIHYI